MPKLLSTEQLNVRITHPSLYKSLLIKAAMLMAGGLAFWVQREYTGAMGALDFSSFIPLRVWAAGLFLSGALVAFGITLGAKRYKYVRYGLYLAAAIAGIWTAFYVAAFVTDEAPTLVPAIFWAYVSGTMAVWASEPTFNPLSAAIHEQQKNGGSNGTVRN